MSSAFWKDKRVLVTGHTGFKGSWLSLWLHRLGADVAGYALAPDTRPNLFTITGVDSVLHSEIADIRDLDKLKTFATNFNPHIIIHMAAQALVRPSYCEPVETYSTNVMGTVNMLEAARACSALKAVVNVTTDKCYENRERDEGYREDEPMGGFDPYSSSKGCAELVTSSYRRSFFADNGDAAVASARAGNVIGGGDWSADRLIPDMLQSFMAGETVDIRNPAAVRPWQHVLEPLYGYLLLAERLCSDKRFAEGWNFGPRDDDARPVAWLADRLVELWGGDANWRNLSDDTQPHEAGFLRLDVTKATGQLGWQPRLDLDTALAWTVEWYQCFQNGGDVRAITEQQIANFESGKTST
ncbi:MAG: CDP-glucose 4,6-dehydratase [Gammaproteobacteria bacterium]|nr:CDP-glucose 4,6-dehydratase [Gammaproteobacteria bacterium]